jgi:uncharacterized protein YkwD
VSPRPILLIAAAAAAALLAAGGVGAAPSSQAQSLSPSEYVLLRVVNQARTDNGLPPLRIDATLERAARWYSVQLLSSNEFDHGDFGDRMAEFGVRGSILGENLAWGSGPQGLASSVVARWLQSPDHRANLLRPSFTRIGIASVEGTFLGYSGSTVVTADFAG